MKWDFQINFEIYHGRHRVFSLRRLIPFLNRWHKKHKNWSRSCYQKTRYKTEQAALNAEWFAKHPAPHRAYACEVCDGWHITTK